VNGNLNGKPLHGKPLNGKPLNGKPLNGKPRGLQERQRLAGRVHRIVTVPAQLDENSAGVADLVQGVQYRREVDLAHSEHQVIVHAAARVFNVHIPE